MEEEKGFVFTEALSRRMVQLRFENDWLFKKKRQPFNEFYKILLENGFPEEMTIKNLRKRWSYMYQSYKAAKREKNKDWKYYKLFDKHFGKAKTLDKYETWNEEWRLKLITCITEAKALGVDYFNMWRTIERALRVQDLPENCCIQDIKGLWHHIKTTFSRKHRQKVKNGNSDWALYDVMMEYYQKFEPETLVRLSLNMPIGRQPKSSDNYRNTNQNNNGEEEYDFQWTKDITETFIQVRLQNDWLFRERKWAWNDLLEIMIKEYGFPKMLTGREICKKWASTFAEYQKSKATNNKSWLYYNLFELYFGEGSLSLNPLIGWQEEWVSNLISARLDLDHLFQISFKDANSPWREVEKRLRSIGLPIDHSLLDLPEMWSHLLKTYKWKKKFATRGMLTEHWPYFEAMAQYDEYSAKHATIKQKNEPNLDYNDDYEDDIKLFDLKQKLDEEKPKLELSYTEHNSCRACLTEEGCVSIFGDNDEHGLNIAQKLRMIADIQVEATDNLPTQICVHCLQELENAYKFRRKCQNVDKNLRTNSPVIKIIKVEHQPESDLEYPKIDPDGAVDDDIDTHFDNLQDTFIGRKNIKVVKRPLKKEPRKIMRKRRKVRKERYEYHKVCEVCGKHTKNLKSHLDTHTVEKLYSCEVCDKKFKFKSGLIIHKAVHDPTPKKTCEVCGKTFHILAQYRRHFVYHANERKFACETCGKRFNTIEILRVHNRIHTDERPFPCSDCGKTFRTAGCVSRHKRIVHRSIKNQINITAS